MISGKISSPSDRYSPFRISHRVSDDSQTPVIEIYTFDKTYQLQCFDKEIDCYTMESLKSLSEEEWHIPTRSEAFLILQYIEELNQLLKYLERTEEGETIDGEYWTSTDMIKGINGQEFTYSVLPVDHKTYPCNVDWFAIFVTSEKVGTKKARLIRKV